MVYLGAHCSIGNGLLGSIKYIESIGGNALQIFLGSNRSGNIKMKSKITDEEIKEANKYLKEKDILLVVHAIYLLNFCKNPPTSSAIKYQLDNLIYDLNMVDKIGGIGVVIHLGSHQDLPIEIAYKNMIDNIIYCINATKKIKAKIIIETSAGQGTQIATTLNEFSKLYNDSKLQPYHNRIGICVDTCHIFSAGHDISSQSKMKQYFNDFDKLIGLKNLTCIHLNDSMVELNAHKDRHQNLVRGYIFDKDLGGDYNSLRVLTDISTKYHVPLILETPGDGAPPTNKDLKIPEGVGSYQYEIRLIKTFLKKTDIDKFPKETVDYVPLYFQYLKDKSKSMPKTVIPNFEQSSFKQNGGASLASEEEPNKTIINIINQLELYYLDRKDKFRSRAYSNALLTLKKYPHKITKNNINELKELDGIGNAIYEKIEEILNTGKLSFLDELEPLSKTEENKNQLESILGFGPAFVSKLINLQITNIESLKQAVNIGKIKLNQQQEIGLKYHDELNKPIPRKDAHDIVKKVELIAKKLYPEIKVVHAGSYPSGKKESKDIDILMTDPKLKIKDDLNKYQILETIVKNLEDKNIIEATLSIGDTKFLGIVKGTLKSPFVKHLDIRLVPEESWVPAYLYFTSGRKFNTMSRTIAKKNGMTLNEWGLFDKDGKRIPTPTEEDIFKEIGLEFIPMNDRR
jgi:apurinic endonuclease APN1